MAAICKNVGTANAEMRACVCVLCFMIMSRLSVFQRQHLSVYAVQIVSKKTGQKECCLIFTHSNHTIWQ